MYSTDSKKLAELPIPMKAQLTRPCLSFTTLIQTKKEWKTKSSENSIQVWSINRKIRTRTQNQIQN